MIVFRQTFGKYNPEEKLPAQTYFENFAEKLPMGTLTAEPLAMVASASEEEP